MKILILICVLGTVAGCSTYRGGTEDVYDNTRYSLYPEPAGSPTFTPGMNPNDLRDSNVFGVPTPTAPEIVPQTPEVTR